MPPRPPPPDADLLERREILDAAGMARVLRRMASELVERVGHQGDAVYLVGIRTGGAYLAQRLAELIRGLGDTPPPTLGAIDISLYRDDVFRGLPKPEIGPTELPEALEGRIVVLVDDVLFTGRTIRAAMDALFDHGRPKRVQLCVLIDRGHRELPIEAAFVGRKVPTTLQEIIEVQLREVDSAEKVLLVEKAG